MIFEGETYSQGFSMTLVIDENDEIPNVIGKDQVTNVFTLTEKDFEAIVDRFEKVFGDLIGEMGGAKEDTPTPIH